MHEGLILCRFLHFGAVSLLFGCSVFRHVLFRSRLPGFEVSPARVRLDRALNRLVVLALLSAVGWLMLTAASMTGDWQDAFSLNTHRLVLSHTFFGRIWCLHLLLCGLLLLLGQKLAPLPRLSISALLLFTLAPVGHGAMFDGTQGALLILNQAVHLASTASWLGGLLMLAVLLKSRSEIDVRRVLIRFSGIGYALVALIVTTGMINVWALSGGFWPDPPFAGFGQVLTVKVAMVLCMLTLAGLNRRLARAPRMNISLLSRSIVLEGLFGAAALIAVSLLGTLPPMSG